AYYAPRTTHDSSLSACTHAVAYAELGDVETAARFFDATARVDLDDTHGNADHGVHVAAMGGTYLGLLDGFAGYRVQGGRMSFRPRLPRRWRRLAFRLNWRGSRVRVDVRRDVTRYELLSGRPVELLHRGRVVTLAHGDRGGADGPGAARRRLRPRRCDHRHRRAALPRLAGAGRRARRAVRQAAQRGPQGRRPHALPAAGPRGLRPRALRGRA